MKRACSGRARLAGRGRPVVRRRRASGDSRSLARASGVRRHVDCRSGERRCEDEPGGAEQRAARDSARQVDSAESSASAVASTKFARHRCGARPRHGILERIRPDGLDEDDGRGLTSVELCGEAAHRRAAVAAESALGRAAALGGVEAEVQERRDHPPDAVAVHGNRLQRSGLVAADEDRIDDAQRPPLSIRSSAADARRTARRSQSERPGPHHHRIPPQPRREPRGVRRRLDLRGREHRREDDARERDHPGGQRAEDLLHRRHGDRRAPGLPQVLVEDRQRERQPDRDDVGGVHGDPPGSCHRDDVLESAAMETGSPWSPWLSSLGSCSPARACSYCPSCSARLAQASQGLPVWEGWPPPSSPSCWAPRTARAGRKWAWRHWESSAPRWLGRGSAMRSSPREPGGGPTGRSGRASAPLFGAVTFISPLIAVHATAPVI
jgi:hypothetical protein